MAEDESPSSSKVAAPARRGRPRGEGGRAKAPREEGDERAEVGSPGTELEFAL